MPRLFRQFYEYFNLRGWPAPYHVMGWLSTILIENISESSAIDFLEHVEDPAMII